MSFFDFQVWNKTLFIMATGTMLQVTRTACKRYDAHSHSWLTLDDIVDYRWHRAIKRGVVPLDVWRRWKREGASNPETWAGGVSGRGIVIIPEAAAAALNPTFNDDKTYVEAEWSTSLRDDCEEFMKAVTPRLQQLEMECGRGNARIVFFFDN